MRTSGDVKSTQRRKTSLSLLKQRQRASGLRRCLLKGLPGCARAWGRGPDGCLDSAQGDTSPGPCASY